MSLADEIEQAKARLALLEGRALLATCLDLGHDWKSIGGCNAGCADDCICSVPVHKCARCGDYDYGENSEATAIIAACKQKEFTQ